MMFEIVFLRFVHCIIALGTFVKQWLFAFPYFWLSNQKKSHFNLETIQADARRLKKLPLHFALLIHEEEKSNVDIANIILWSICLGISYISIYDVNGHLKRYSCKLKEAVNSRRAEILQKDNTKYHIHMSVDSTDKVHANGYNSCNRVDIQILSQEDGGIHLVETARELSHKVANMEYKLKDICPENVDHLLQGKQNFPDPDFIVLFGNVDSLLGFLPWQCRLTEIFSSPSHIGFQYKTYLTLLSLFGKTQQRFGT